MFVEAYCFIVVVSCYAEVRDAFVCFKNAGFIVGINHFLLKLVLGKRCEGEIILGLAPLDKFCMRFLKRKMRCAL